MFENWFGKPAPALAGEFYGAKYPNLGWSTGISRGFDVTYQFVFKEREYRFVARGNGEEMIVTGVFGVSGSRVTLKPTTAYSKWSAGFEDTIVNLGLPGTEPITYELRQRDGVLIIEDVAANGSGIFEVALYRRDQRPRLTV